MCHHIKHSDPQIKEEIDEAMKLKGKIMEEISDEAMEKLNNYIEELKMNKIKEIEKKFDKKFNFANFTWNDQQLAENQREKIKEFYREKIQSLIEEERAEIKKLNKLLELSEKCRDDDIILNKLNNK